ncbi:hypothetical protein BHF71_08335 [Vulcanibacillus modesticaldus]|uniref:SHOCT domain-containing protein n=1 Tax=Vulcanibacillus modesticaldus TaxID=337097 RepID=A0A1D2YVB9_9BACI|nr:YppF family protein [Vulcanibacillus modesticaldus]OEF99621.1 hypothetical protein BHF71_08335 [Vulcanibacillus modesticaldus]
MFGGHMMGGFGRGFGGFYPGGYGMWYGGGFTDLLFWILIGVVVYLLVKKSRNSNFNVPKETIQNNEALELAKLRYIRGEITLDEYQEIVKVLKQ